MCNETIGEPTLYGIVNSNRMPCDFWGKNQFNSSFPVALANYMRDSGVKVQYIQIDANLNTFISELDVGKLYNAEGIRNDELYFSFEDKFVPYQHLSYDNIGNIDLVVKHIDGRFLRPLEVKLTVIPDNTTKNLTDERMWGSEVVIRAATTSYCALGMANAFQNNLTEIREIFEADCTRIESWSNSVEMRAKLPRLTELINIFEQRFYQNQQPLVMQPIWKSQGQSPLLADNAFDLFVWSDYAFTRLFLNSALTSTEAKKPVSRPMRSTARLARFLYEISRNGKVGLDEIYRQMTFNHQTDKEFAVSGHTTNKYMRCPRLETPAISREALYDIILNGGERMLMPERRFDQSIYFTMAHE